MRSGVRPLPLGALAALLGIVGCSEEKPAPAPGPQPAASAASAPAAEPATAPEVSRGDLDITARNNKGVGLMGRFDFVEAQKVFDTLAAEHPNDNDIAVNRAISVLNQAEEGKQESALAILEAVLQRDPGHVNATYCAGLIELYLGRTDAALARFEAVSKADPADAYAVYFTAQCLDLADRMEDAAKAYERALELDGYLRSAWLGLQRCYAQLGRDVDADRAIAEFERLGTNPRSKLAQFKYSRMGTKGMARVRGEQPVASTIPSVRNGKLFGAPAPLIAQLPAGVRWRERTKEESISITACDIDADRRTDLFIARAFAGSDGLHNAVCLQRNDGSFAIDPEHALARVEGVNAALWGDVDNDGFVDVYLCRDGVNALWRSRPAGGGTAESKLTWEEISASARAGNGELNTVDGALADFDHDGDLDIFCVNADGSNELLSNNLDGTFRPIAADAGISSPAGGSRRVLPVDFDSDRDLDIIVLNNRPPHSAWRNERQWKYVPAVGMDDLLKSAAVSISSGDVDADGQAELLTWTAAHAKNLWRRTKEGRWTSEGGRTSGEPDWSSPLTAQLADVNGDGALDQLVPERGGLWIDYGNSHEWITEPSSIHDWCILHPQPSSPAQIITWPWGPDAGPVALRAAADEATSVSISLRGRSEPGDLTPGQTMRSNASGIGASYAARVRDHWIAGSTLRTSPGPGQSLQPALIGLGDAGHADFIEIDWSDGVFQTEVHGAGDADAAVRDFTRGKHETIVETQRQISSCPVLFAHDGERMTFITDLLGVGGIGYLVRPGEYAPSRPWENVLLPAGAISPVDGRYKLSLAEPMEEACYLDAVRLIAWDLPAGWNLVLDERMSILGPEPTGAPVFYRTEFTPARATNERGEEVTDAIADADLRAAPPGAFDHRFIGRLADEHLLTIEFAQPLPSQPVSLALVADGWVEYPYSQTMFAAWQAGADYRAPTLEARDAAGNWSVILDQFGYPAGMPRRMSVPLPPLPEGCTALRLRTNQEIYWDRLSIVVSEPCPAARRHDLILADARCRFLGYPLRTTGPQRQPHYEYDRRTPFWDCRHQSGWYTAFGACAELVAAQDDALAIFGPGEELQLEFEALPAAAPATVRRLVLETNGWCKDMDLFTRDGETVGPLPTTGRDPAIAKVLHGRFNTRFESGQ